MRHRSTTIHRTAGLVVMAMAALWGAATLVTLFVPATSAEVVRALAGVRVASPWLVALEGAFGAGAAVALVTSRASSVRCPAAPASPQEQVQLHTVQAIVDAHGEDSLSPFVVRPDKCFELAGDTVIAYRQIGRTLVVSGDPVGPADQHAHAFERLRQRCAAAGLTPVVYGAGAGDLDLYRRAGMRALCVGEEAIVDPAAFSLEGRAVRKVRQSVNRVAARGWVITTVDGRDVDDALAGEIDSVERAWRAAHPRILGFAMSFGVHEHGARPDDLLVIARSPEGELRAVMRFLSHRAKLSLDTMRRVGPTPNGLNEALVCRALAVARKRGVVEVSLNYAGLANLLHSERRNGRVRGAAQRILLRLLGHSFQLERLVCFNDKFSPTWRPRYLVYTSRPALGRSILRVLQAEGYVPTRHRHDPERLRSAHRVLARLGAQSGAGR